MGYDNYCCARFQVRPILAFQNLLGIRVLQIGDRRVRGQCRWFAQRSVVRKQQQPVLHVQQVRVFDIKYYGFMLVSSYVRWTIDDQEPRDVIINIRIFFKTTVSFRVHLLTYTNVCFVFFFHPRDNDRSSLNCASMLKGGWWWKSCGRGLNGLYLNDPQDLTARQGKRERTWATQQSPADVSLGARKGRQDGPYAPLQSFNRHTHSDFSNALSYLIFGLILLCPPTPPLINWPRVPTLVSIVLLLRTVEPKRYGVSNRVTLWHVYFFHDQTRSNALFLIIIKITITTTD